MNATRLSCYIKSVADALKTNHFYNNMSKITSLTAAFLLICSAVFAQAGTIQVTVSDTILVPANRISVAVSFKDTAAPKLTFSFDTQSDREPSDEDNQSDDTNDVQEPKEPAKPDFLSAYKQATQILKKEGIQWKKPTEQFPFLGGMGAAAMGLEQGDTLSKGFMIEFSSKQQMDRVLPRLKAITFVNATEMSIAADKELVDKKRLYAKLLVKARAKADEIAGLAGKRTGDIHQIGSAFEMFSPEKYMESLTGAGGMFGGIFKMLGGMFNEKTPDYKVSVSESMTVTFYLVK